MKVIFTAEEVKEMLYQGISDKVSISENRIRSECNVKLTNVHNAAIEVDINKFQLEVEVP